ncbi:MAG: hypothetical protein AAFQ36_04960 [Pseudomonadota bacterium]
MCNICADGFDAVWHAADTSSTTFVTDYTALLAYSADASSRVNANTDVGTPVVVTYRFLNDNQLPSVADALYGETAFTTMDREMRTLMRDALDEAEDITGIKFVEVKGAAMINAFSFIGADTVAGWANYPGVREGFVFQEGGLTVEDGLTDFDVYLHELGHALGLKHPFDGAVRLTSEFDNDDFTLMSYGDGAPTEFQSIDVAALEHLYGVPSLRGVGVKYKSKKDTVVIDAASDGTKIVAADRKTLFKGDDGDDHFIGRYFRDSFKTSGGNDIFDGGGGRDTLQLTAKQKRYDIGVGEDLTLTFTHKKTGDSVSVTDVERFKFKDKNWTLKKVLKEVEDDGSASAPLTNLDIDIGFGHVAGGGGLSGLSINITNAAVVASAPFDLFMFYSTDGSLDSRDSLIGSVENVTAAGAQTTAFSVYRDDDGVMPDTGFVIVHIGTEAGVVGENDHLEVSDLSTWIV